MRLVRWFIFIFLVLFSDTGVVCQNLETGDCFEEVTNLMDDYLLYKENKFPFLDKGVLYDVKRAVVVVLVDSTGHSELLEYSFGYEHPLMQLDSVIRFQIDSIVIKQSVSYINCSGFKVYNFFHLGDKVNYSWAERRKIAPEWYSTGVQTVIEEIKREKKGLIYGGEKLISLGSPKF